MSTVEEEIKAKGLVAPRVTPQRVQDVITREQYYRFPGTTTTVCCLSLLNGFTVIGESACASESNFDEGLGRRVARESAVQKIWALEGYLLRQALHDNEQLRTQFPDPGPAS